jgi:hypothetical protein
LLRATLQQLALPAQKLVQSIFVIGLS